MVYLPLNVNDVLSISCMVLQLRRHGDVLPEGAGARGKPEPHAAEADGRSRLHNGSPGGLPSNAGQLRGPAGPEAIRYGNNAPGLVIKFSGFQSRMCLVPCCILLDSHGIHDSLHGVDTYSTLPLRLESV